MANYYNKQKILKNLVTAITIVNLSGLQVAFNTVSATEAAAIPAPVDNDIIKLLESLNNYRQTSDIAIGSKASSSFYRSDSEIDKALQKKATDAMLAYDQSGDAAQTDATKAMITSLVDATTALKAKLVLQKAALKAFDDAGKEAANLLKAEKAAEAQCLLGLKNALLAGSSVANDCNALDDEDEKKKCGAELDACANKINADLNEFSNTYLTKRNKLQASKPGYKEVNDEAKILADNLLASPQVCTRYTVKMLSLENSGNCIAKVKNDEKNEAYQGSTVDTNALGIHVSLDSNMLIPEHRIPGWAKLKQMAEVKIKETEKAIADIKVYLKKLGKSDDASVEGTNISDDDTLALLTNSGTTVSLGILKKFFATNPTPADILREAAGLGLTKDQIAHAMNLVGYGGKKPSDPNNFAQTRAVEAEYMAIIDGYVSSKGGNFNGPSGSIQVPGITQIDATKNVMSNQGWVTPAMVKAFLDTNPTDQQFLARMAELGLRASDIATILNGQGLLFNNNDPRQVQLNDRDFGSIFNRLQVELYQGTTGYGVADTYDAHSPIVTGTGHIMSEDNTTWIPYGFSGQHTVNQHVNTSNQAPVPTSFETGGQFGVTQNAIKKNSKTKVITAEGLKKLTTK